MIRAISYSEGNTLLDCQARWDFRYGDRLAGSSLREKSTPILLRDGKAWGRAVAALHADDEYGLANALVELRLALREDSDEQKEAGTYDPDEFERTHTFLGDVLDHYATTTEHLPIESLEHELLVPLPSRSGKGDSNRYRLQVFFDGLHTDEAGRIWIVEFKLRKLLSSLELIAGSRQIRYYAWAYRKATGNDVAGVIVDERLKAAPKPARILDSGKPSHAKDQMTTPERYIAACEERDVEPKPETIESLKGRRWQQRERIFLTDAEIEEAGTELVSLGQQVAALDGGHVYPVRHPSRARCPGCAFREICTNPNDTELVEALFDRKPAKRDREELPA
jgi:hypothetical protein